MYFLYGVNYLKKYVPDKSGSQGQSCPMQIHKPATSSLYKKTLIWNIIMTMMMNAVIIISHRKLARQKLLLVQAVWLYKPQKYWYMIDIIYWYKLKVSLRKNSAISDQNLNSPLGFLVFKWEFGFGSPVNKIHCSYRASEVIRLFIKWHF